MTSMINIRSAVPTAKLFGLPSILIEHVGFIANIVAFKIQGYYISLKSKTATKPPNPVNKTEVSLCIRQ